MGRKKKDRAFWESGILNNSTYRLYYNRLTELAISMFEWKGLPPTIDPRYLELILFTDGQAVFFKDEELGCLCLQNMSSGDWNVYRVPKQREAYSVNGYHKKLSDKDSVIIYNNYLRTNTQADVKMFANRLYNLDRIIDVNCNAQKTPLLIMCDENERLTLENLYKQYDGNMPVIKGDKNLRPESLKCLTTGAPFVSGHLYELKTQYWNEALTALGISNTSYQKKERLISDEVLRSQGGTIASRYSRLEMRQQACKQINDMFKLNVSCEYRDDVRVYNENSNKEGVEK